MNTLKIFLSDNDRTKYNIQSDQLSFTELVEKIVMELGRESLMKCRKIAQEEGLSEINLEDIDKEINAARNAKNRS